MPDGAVIIAAITSCTNTSNPRNVIAAGCWRATPASWAWCASRG
jgi:aconitase A